MADPIELEQERARRNREMVERAKHRESYIAQGDGDELTPEQQAHAWTQRMRALAKERLAMSPETVAALERRGLGGLVSGDEMEIRAFALRWQDEHQAQRAEHLAAREMQRTRRESQRPPHRRPVQVPGMPVGVTTVRARLLDLYLVYGATVKEIAQIETISDQTVRNILTEIYKLMGVDGKGVAAGVWHQWRASAGYTSDGLLEQRLSLLRGTSPLAYQPYTLTDRQRQILLLLVEGLSRREMAGRLGLSEQTVKHLLTEMYRAMGVRSAAAAIARYHAECATEEAI